MLPLEIQITLTLKLSRSPPGHCPGPTGRLTAPPDPKLQYAITNCICLIYGTKTFLACDPYGTAIFLTHFPYGTTTFLLHHLTDFRSCTHHKYWAVPKHRCKHDSVPSNFDTRKHFDYNIASLTGIVIYCSVSSSCNDCSNHWRPVSGLVSSCIANLNKTDMAKQLRLMARMNFSLKN